MPSHPLSENTKHSFPENGYECFFCLHKKRGKDGERKNKSGCPADIRRIGEDMKRVNLIYRHPLYQKKYNALQKAEEHRKFCNHTLEHFLDVARLMYIYSVEQELSISKEVIYAAAFMHDIGRIDQIEKGIPHEMAGAALCDRILPDCGFAKEEISLIKDFILHHRIKDTGADTPLYEMLYWADKKSRNCFACAAQAECNWDRQKMNLEIDY